MVVVGAVYLNFYAFHGRQGSIDAGAAAGSAGADPGKGMGVLPVAGYHAGQAERVTPILSHRWLAASRLPVGGAIPGLPGFGGDPFPRSSAGLGGAWWVLVRAPTALVPLIVLVNEHRLYLAVPAFCAVIRFALCQLGGRSRVAPILTVAYFLAVTILTMQRTQNWESELRLWQDVAAKGPLMVKPRFAVRGRPRPGGGKAEGRRTPRRGLPGGVGKGTEQRGDLVEPRQFVSPARR